jgi:hypothetical protein
MPAISTATIRSEHAESAGDAIGRRQQRRLFRAFLARCAFSYGLGGERTFSATANLTRWSASMSETI